MPIVSSRDHMGDGKIYDVVREYDDDGAFIQEISRVEVGTQMSQEEMMFKIRDLETEKDNTNARLTILEAEVSGLKLG